MISTVILVIVRNLEIYFLRKFCLLTKLVRRKIRSFPTSVDRAEKEKKREYLERKKSLTKLLYLNLHPTQFKCNEECHNSCKIQY